MKQKKLMDTLIEVEAVDKHGHFEGYASVFDHTDSVRDQVKAGAFAESLKQAKQKDKMPPLLWQHDTSEPIGAWTEIFEDRHGLYVKGELFIEDIPRARQAFKLMREKALTGLSIGFKARESFRDPDTGERILTQIDLLEISLVTFPALESARISHVRKSLQSGEMPDERTVEAFLREAGFSRKQAKGFIAAGYKSLGRRDAGPEEKPIELDAIRSLTERLKKLTYANTNQKDIYNGL